MHQFQPSQSHSVLASSPFHSTDWNRAPSENTTFFVLFFSVFAIFHSNILELVFIWFCFLIERELFWCEKMFSTISRKLLECSKTLTNHISKKKVLVPWSVWKNALNKPSSYDERKSLSIFTIIIGKIRDSAYFRYHSEFEYFLIFGNCIVVCLYAWDPLCRVFLWSRGRKSAPWENASIRVRKGGRKEEKKQKKKRGDVANEAWALLAISRSYSLRYKSNIHKG